MDLIEANKSSTDKSEHAVFITADADGLEYLAGRLQANPGKEGPAAHFHLMPEMANLLPSSLEDLEPDFAFRNSEDRSGR